MHQLMQSWHYDSISIKNKRVTCEANYTQSGIGLGE
jgi:hypothetical protein